MFNRFQAKALDFLGIRAKILTTRNPYMWEALCHQAACMFVGGCYYEQICEAMFESGKKFCNPKVILPRITGPIEESWRASGGARRRDKGAGPAENWADLIDLQ